MTETKAPVITLDGPSGTGKGTITALLAQALGWHMLDSGAVYRAVAWAALDQKVAVDDETAIAAMIARTDIRLISRSLQEPVEVSCDGVDITQAIRQEGIGMNASRVSAFPAIRAGVLGLQHQFRQYPGLIADGRDMGTVVFPDADLKLYLDADVEVRAQRRYQQLKINQLAGDLAEIEADLQQRDQQDSQRAISPLQPATGAIIIDTSRLSIDQVFTKVMVNVRRFVL